MVFRSECVPYIPEREAPAADFEVDGLSKVGARKSRKSRFRVVVRF